MSSVHNDLAGWAQKARLRGHKTIEIDVETADRAAEQIISQAVEIERLRAALIEIATTEEYRGLSAEEAMSVAQAALAPNHTHSEGG